MSFLNTINTSANLTNRSLSLLDVGDLLGVFMCVTAHAKLTVWVLPGQKGTCSGWSFCFPQLKSRYARLLTVGLVALLLSSLRLQRVFYFCHTRWSSHVTVNLSVSMSGWSQNVLGVSRISGTPMLGVCWLINVKCNQSCLVCFQGILEDSQSGSIPFIVNWCHFLQLIDMGLLKCHLFPNLLS